MRLSTRVLGTVLAALFVLPAMTTATATATPWCGTDSLRLSTSGPISPGQQPYIHFYVILTNSSQQTCTMQGYPGVDLVGPDDPGLGTTYSMPRRSNVAMPDVPVVLAPGAQAASLVGFLPKSGPDGLASDHHRRDAAGCHDVLAAAVG
jgi:hypothetical protein